MKFIIENNGKKIYKSLDELTEEDYSELTRQPKDFDGIDVGAGFYQPLGQLMTFENDYRTRRAFNYLSVLL